jgi:hypothetical protein
MGASVVGTAGANGSGVGFPSNDRSGRALYGVSPDRWMVYLAGGNPLITQTGNTSAQFLLDGGTSRLRVPLSAIIQLSQPTIGSALAARGGWEFNVLLGVKNNTGGARTVTFNLNSGGIAGILAMGSLASDNTEYLVTLKHTNYALGGTALTNIPIISALEMNDGGGTVPTNSGAGGVPVIRRYSRISAGIDMTVDSTPIFSVTADVTNAALTVAMYQYSLEGLGPTFTPFAP